MRLPSIAGTRAAADRCGECGHARIRHTDGGYGRCVQAQYPAQAAAGAPYLAASRCPCRTFTTTKEVG